MKATSRNVGLAGGALLAIAVALLNFRAANGPDRSGQGPEFATPAESPVITAAQPPAAPPDEQPQRTALSAPPTTGGTSRFPVGVASHPQAPGSNQPGAAVAPALRTNQGLLLPHTVPLTPPIVVPPERRVSGTVPQSGTNRDYSPP